MAIYLRYCRPSAVGRPQAPPSSRRWGASICCSRSSKTLFLRLELERHRFDAVTQAGGGRAVVEHVAQVGAAVLAYHFGAHHAVAGIAFACDLPFLHRLIKARPAG